MIKFISIVFVPLILGSILGEAMTRKYNLSAIENFQASTCISLLLFVIMLYVWRNNERIF